MRYKWHVFYSLHTNKNRGLSPFTLWIKTMCKETPLKVFMVWLKYGCDMSTTIPCLSHETYHRAYLPNYLDCLKLKHRLGHTKKEYLTVHDFGISRHRI